MNQKLLIFTSCLICAAALSLFFIQTTFAAQSASISVGQITAEPGDHIVVPITLESNPGMATLLLSIEYDSSRLRIANQNEVSRGSALNRLSFVGPDGTTYRNNPFRVMWFGTTNDRTTGVLLNIGFTVLDNAAAGEAVVSVSVGSQDAANLTGEIITVQQVPGGINVLGDGTGTPYPVVTPSPSPTPGPGRPGPTPIPSPTPGPGQPGPTPTPSPTPGPGQPGPIPTPGPSPVPSPEVPEIPVIPSPLPSPHPYPLPSPTPPAQTLPPVPPESFPTPEPTPVPPQIPGLPGGSRDTSRWNAVVPRQVPPSELPANIQTLTDGSPVFIAGPVESDPNDDMISELVPGPGPGPLSEPISELMSILVTIPYTRGTDIIAETLLAYHIRPTGEMELVILSLYDESQSVIRLIGYRDEFYIVSSNLVTFADVSPAAWYHRAVTFVAARGLFAGVSYNQFAPHTTLTRGMFITVLSNLDGIDLEDIDGSLYTHSPFDDVNIGEWYGPPISWAYQAGIIEPGMLLGSPSAFRPHDNITREEMAVIFANYMAIRDFPLNLNEINAPEFYDMDQASPWAREAIRTMRGHSIISGVGDNLYNPQGEATRAEAAQIFTNLIRAIVGLS